MRASTRRTLALFSAAALGLAACATDDDADDDVNGADQQSAEDMDPDALPDDLEGQDPPEPPTFDEGDLEDGEVVPGVRVEVPEGGDIEAGPGPTGSIFAATYEEEEAIVFIEAAAAGLTIDQLLEGLQAIEESGEAEITRGPEDIEVEGADDAQIVELVDAQEREATLVVAVAGDGAVSLAVERPGGSDFDADTIIESLAVDGERIAEGSAGMDPGMDQMQPAPDAEGAPAPEDEDAPDPDDEG